MKLGTKIAIAGVVGGVLAYYFNSQRKKGTKIGNVVEKIEESVEKAMPTGGGGGGGGSFAPVDTPAIVTTEIAEDGSTTTTTTTATDGNGQTILPLMGGTPSTGGGVPKPNFTVPPSPTAKPSTPDYVPRPTGQPSPSPSAPPVATGKISRFSGFQGGSNYVEVGADLNDL